MFKSFNIFTFIQYDIFYADFEYGKDSFLKIIIHNHKDSLINLWLSKYLLTKKIGILFKKKLFWKSKKQKYNS